LRGRAFGENAQTIPQTRRSVGLARVEIVTDNMKKGADGENKLMADHSQTAAILTNLYNASQNYDKIVLFYFFDAIGKRSYQGRSQHERNGGKTT
jgi:hypothetical protein